MNEEKSSHQDTSVRTPATQFSLGWLLLLMTVSAVVLGIAKATDVGFGLAAFAIGFLCLMSLIGGLIRTTRSNLVVVHETSSVADATLCRDYLVQSGIMAVVHSGDLAGFPGLSLRATQVLVPASDLERARSLLAELRDQASTN